MKVQRVATDLGTEYGIHDRACSQIVELDSAIPTSRDQKVLILRVKLHSKDSVRMTNVVARSLCHYMNLLLCHFIIDRDMCVRAGCCKESAILSEIKCV